jgi:DNA-binding MarR family transcriptional regulator
MTDLAKEVEVNEALFNIGNLIGRLPSDEGKRLSMLMATVMKHMKQLEKENARLKDDDEFDMDGRC